MLLALVLSVGNMWGEEYTLLDQSTGKLTNEFFDQQNVNDLGASKKVTIEGQEFRYYVKTSANRTSWSATNYGTNFIEYDLKTNNTKFTLYLGNTSSNQPQLYYCLLQEGVSEAPTLISLGDQFGKGNSTAVYKKIELTLDTITRNTRVAFCTSKTDLMFFQILAEETGSPFLQPGEDGYVINFNKGRYAGMSSSNKAGWIDDKIEINAYNDYKPISGTEIQLTKKSTTNFIKFTTKNNPIALVVTYSNGVCVNTSNTHTNAINLKGSEKGVKLAANQEYWLMADATTNSNPKITKLAFLIPQITYEANGGEGTMDATEWTVAENGFTAPEGKKFDKWTTSQDGTGTDVVKAVGAEVTENTTLYAQWKADVAEYIVTYKDGETTLKSVNVNVTSAPEAYTPTKALCSFAGWKDGEGNDVTLSSLASSAAENDIITLYAQWTKLYAQSVDFTSYLLETERLNKSLATVIEENGLNYTCGGTFSSSEWGKTSGEEAAFQGYKFKDKNVYIEFRVEANKHVTLLFGNYGATGKIKVGDADAIDCTLTDSKYEINTDAEVIIRFTTNTGSGSTVTLKKITISSLYTASYVDETGDGEAGGDDENVAEVTLPTPSETTVTVAEKEYTFTGWTANEAVTVDDAVVAAGTSIAAGKVAVLSANTTFTAQWQEVSDFDVKFFPGYGENAEIGTTQKISTNGNATAPTDPTREGYKFLGWSTDGTEANIVNVATYAITVATNFTAVWKQVWTVTFDGAGNVEVENGEKVASPNSPVQAGKVFQGWYNEEVKYDFSSAVASNLALTSKWADADANHYVYAYNDDFHFDGVVYKTPEGKTTDPEAAEATLNLTTPYTLFSGAAGITSIVVTNGIYDYKKAADTKHVTSYLKINTGGSSKIDFTIATGYTAVLKMKMGGYSANPTITLKKGEDVVDATSGEPGGKKASIENDFNEITYELVAGTYTLTTATKTLYISHIDLQAEAIPAKTVTYHANNGTTDQTVDDAATAIADCSFSYSGHKFIGWNESADGTGTSHAVDEVVAADLELYAQWKEYFTITYKDGEATIGTEDVFTDAAPAGIANPVKMGNNFAGWVDGENNPVTIASLNAVTTVYAKWTAFDGCVELWPATSGTGSGEEGALAVDDVIAMQTGSFGGTMKITNLGSGAMSYTSSGLAFASKSGPTVSVVLNNEMSAVAGTQIQITLVAGGEKTRGLTLKKANGDNISAFTCWVEGTNDASNGAEETFTYIVQEGDGLDGTNEFQLARNNTVYLKSLKVLNCGDAIVYHNVTSAVDPTDKGTVTLGASSVREGRTTTAEYSAIDPLYEFVNWTVSGAGASIADASANPATITMGTEDAVVTLNLKVKPVKFTVNYFDGTTAMGTEQVAVNENPTASEIVTAKRHYTFLGWSDTDGGDVVALNTITRTEAGTINLYAKYEAVVCPTSGTIFSMESDEAKKPTSTVTIAKDASIDLAEYATISGGNAMIINGETSGKDAISTDGEFLLKATKEVMKIELNCVLQEGDIIRIPDNSAKLVISTSATKTGTYQAFADKNTHQFAVSDAWENVDDIYILYDGTSLKFTQVEVYRPAVFTVSFDMKDHGSAIAAITNVLEGSKITAPTAPTDENYSFAGWYKENTLENAWNFDADVVEANTTLYAKWLDKSDATLKSLKYGTTEIELQAGVYTYAVELPSLTTAVPALTAETNNPNAGATVTNADAFDGEGNASSTVEVTPEKEGAAHQTYTVNFTKLPSMPLLDVEESIVWDFANAGTQNNSFTDEVLANFPGVTNNATFSAQTLKASGAKIKDGYLQGTPVLFHATKAGLLRVEFANTGSAPRPYRYLVVNGVRTAYKSNSTTHVTTAWIEVPAGDVTIEGECVADASGSCSSDNLNFYKIEFLAVGHERTVVVGDLGTVCLPNACVARGVTVYEYQGADEIGKIVFDELGADEVLGAGKPYIFQVKETNARFFYTTDAAVGSPDNTMALKGNLGEAITFDPHSAEAEHVYFVKDHAFWMAKNTGVKIGQYRCYLQMDEVAPVSSPNPAPGRRRIVLGVQGEQVATGIDELNASEAPIKVMIDGQLFIIRGEKMYNANGQLVK